MQMLTISSPRVQYPVGLFAAANEVAVSVDAKTACARESGKNVLSAELKPPKMNPGSITHLVGKVPIGQGLRMGTYVQHPHNHKIRGETILRLYDSIHRSIRVDLPTVNFYTHP